MNNRQSVMLTSSRYLALAFAIALAIVETVTNSSQPHWQYAPLWVIDYISVAYMVVGFWMTRRGKYFPILMTAYALSTGVLYMAFFVNFDPELPDGARGQGTVVAVIGLALGVSIAGLVATTAAWLPQERATG